MTQRKLSNAGFFNKCVRACVCMCSFVGVDSEHLVVSFGEDGFNYVEKR